MALKLMNRIMPVLAAIILILPILVPGGSNNLVLLPKAEAATIDITTDTTWGDKTIFPGTIYNIAAGATLTIIGKVSNNGEINVYGTLDVTSSNGQLLVNKQGKEQGTVNIHSGGTLNVYWYLVVEGLVDVNPGGTLNVKGGGSDIKGTLNIDGKLETDGGGVTIFPDGGVVRVNDGGIFHNSRTSIFGTLNINNGGKLENDHFIQVYSEGTLQVFTGGTLDNNDSTIYKLCGGTFTLNPGSSFTGNPITRDACIAINDVSLDEGNSGTTTFVFKVSRSDGTTGTTTVDWITIARTATAGTDYVSRSGTLTFTDGQTSKTVKIAVKGDTTVEPNERFTVRLSDCSRYCGIVDNMGVGTIKNDDG